MRYRDEEWLEETYKQHTLDEMAAMEDVSRATIIRWMDKHGLERKTAADYTSASGKFENRQWLQEKYTDERKTTREIAELCDVTAPTIQKWLKKHDISIRHGSEAIKTQWEDNEERRKRQAERFARLNRKLHPFFFTDQEGYVRAGSSDGNGGSIFVKIHVLTAIAYGADPYELFGGDKVIHHDNEVKWDNSPKNLEVMTASEHSKHHAEKRDAEPPRWWE